MKYVALGMIRMWQLTFAKALPPACRFEPSCSHYGYAAISKYGFFKGGWLTIRRIARCQPFNPGGYDPVP